MEQTLLGLPLANLGKNTWVPLEFLMTSGHAETVQQVPCAGYMTSSLQERRAKYDLDGNKDRLTESLNEAVKAMRGRF